MKKALLCGLSAALLLALVLVACNKPQADQPTEPDQTQAVTSTPEPEQTPEPPEQTPAAPEQLSGTTQADPDEADPSQPPEETAPQEPATDPEPAQTTTPAPENTPKPTTNTAPQESQPTIVEPPEPVPEPEGDGGGTQQAPATGTTQATNKDNWDDEVYSWLTPEQKAVYESLDGSSRAAMNKNIRDKAALDAQGWTTDRDETTDEANNEAWGRIHMG